MALQEVRRYDDDFKMWHSAYTNMTFLAHWHEEIELIRVRFGEASITVGNQTYAAKAGDLILCESNCIHYCDSAGSKNILEFILADPVLVQSRRTPLSLRTQHISAAVLAAHGMQDAADRLFSELPAELAQKAPFYESIAQNTLRVFLCRWQRLSGDGTKDSDGTFENESIVQQAITFMEANASDELSLNQVARQVNVSPCYISRLFKKYTGMNFVKYRNYLRLNNAVHLLQKTTLSVSEIAFTCGYQDIRTFNRVFMQYTSHTPLAFRKHAEWDMPVIFSPHQQGGNLLIVENDSPVVTQNLTLG